MSTVLACPHCGAALWVGARIMDPKDQAKAGKARMAGMTQAERRALAQKAVAARWAKGAAERTGEHVATAEDVRVATGHRLGCDCEVCGLARTVRA
jgi:hypothetical protein